MIDNKVANLLPEYLQTYVQKSILSSTADRMFSRGETKKINSFIGHKPSYYNSSTDFYKTEITDERQRFQLEPAVVFGNNILDYPDYISHISTNGTNVSNPHRPLATEIYTWCPYINISKLDDYLDYYWCPFGAPIIKIQVNSSLYLLDKEGTHEFNLKSLRHNTCEPVVTIDGITIPFSIVDNKIVITATFDMVGKQVEIYETTDLKKSIESAGVTWAYYSSSQVYTYANIKYYDFSTTPPTSKYEVTALQPNELYTIEKLVHGMILEIEDNQGSHLYEVKISGSSVSLVNYAIPDGSLVNPNYYTIERNADNRNKWSLNNLWVHKDALIYSNSQYTVKQAERPIIEYSSYVKLFNYGLNRKQDVQYGYSNKHGFALFNTTAESIGSSYILTKNITVEYLNTLNYNIFNDGRIVIMDSTPEHENKVYGTKTLDTRKISSVVGLTPTQREWYECSKFDNTSNSRYTFDSYPWDGGTFVELDTTAYPDEPQTYDYVQITNHGYFADGLELSFDGEQWGYTQQYKDGVAPLFDLFDQNGKSFASKTTYKDSGFEGELIFGYKTFNGAYDKVLNFNVVKNKYNNFIFTDNLSNPFEYKGSKINKFVALVHGKEFEFKNHWHLNNYSIEEVDSNNNYNVHSSIQANPFNNNIVDISKNYWSEHFISLKENQSWNMHSSGIDYSRGTKIKQHRNSSMLAMSLVCVGIDFLDCLKYSEREYSRFHSKFINKLKQVDQDTGLPIISKVDSEYVMIILKEMFATKNELHPFFDNTTSKLGTFIPNTPSYLGITRLYKPYVENNIVYCHDGSMYLRETSVDTNALDDLSLKIVQAVYNLEMIIYSEALKHNASIDKYGFNFDEIVSNVLEQKEYEYSDFVSAANQFFVRWVYTKNVDFRTNSKFDRNNQFTYNYSSSTNFLGKQLPGGYRGMYKQLFRTDTPHSTPWEMLKLLSKPSWWDDVYSWTDRTKREKLLNSLQTGLQTHPDSTNKTYVVGISYIKDKTPVGMDGSLLSPIQANIISLSANDKFDASWNFGDYGPVENGFWKSKESSFALAGAAYVLKPSKLISGSWLCNDEVFKNGQWTKLSNGSREFDKTQYVHGEIVNDIHIRRFGVQTIISDYLKSIGKNITTEFGNVVRQSDTKLIHKFGGFIQDDLSIYSETTGVIPKNNFTTLLHTSPPKHEFFYSGVLISKHEGQYTIYGYNPIRPVFYAYLVNDDGPAHTISLDYLSIPSEWKRIVDYRKDNVVRYGSRVYKCVISHTSGDKFVRTNWQLIRILSSTGNDVKWYTDFKDAKLVKYDYGHTFSDLQELINFLNGYDHFLKTIGFQFTKINNVTNKPHSFRESVYTILSWDDKIFAEDGDPFITVSPGSAELKFNYDFGFVEQVDISRNGLYGILNERGISISSKDIETEREEKSFLIRTKNNTGVYGLRIGLKESEHVLVIDNVTSFGDVMYDSIYDIRQERLRISCTTNAVWNGTTNVDGSIIIDGKSYLNFESKAQQLQNLYETDLSNSTQISDLLKHMVGYQDREYLDNLMLNNQNKFEFYQGMIQHKGTPTVQNRLLRSEKLVQNKNIKFVEEWAFNISRYGNISAENTFDVKISADDVITKDVLVNIQKVDNTKSSVELTAMDTTNTAVSLYTNSTNLDSRILGGYSTSIFAESSNYDSDYQLSAGYILPQDFTYSMISDTFFNSWIATVPSELTTYDTLHFVNPIQYSITLSDGNSKDIAIKNSTFIVSDKVTTLRNIELHPDGLLLKLGKYSNLVVGDYIYIDKSAMDDYEFCGVYPVIGVSFDDVIIAAPEHEFEYTIKYPNVYVLSPTTLKIAPTEENIGKIRTGAITLNEVVVNRWNYGYAFNELPSHLYFEAFPQIRLTSIPDGMLYYVECGFSKNSYELLKSNKPRWAVFKYNKESNTFTNICIQPLKTNIENVTDIQIYSENAVLDLNAKTLEANPLITDQIVLVKPDKHLFPGAIDIDLDFISSIDPCDYTEWGLEKNGCYWFDTSKCAYYSSETRLSYTTENCNILKSNVLELVDGSEVAIYKWTISDTHPRLYKGSGIVYNPEQFTTISEYGIVYYCFWVRDSLDVPKTKRASTKVLAGYLANLGSSGFEMLSPLHKNGLVLNGVSKNLRSDTFLRIKSDSSKDTAKFSEWILMRANDKTSIPTDDLWNSLVYSLAGKRIDRVSIPYSTMNSVDKYGCDYRNGQTWFKNLDKARSYAMQSLNRIFSRNNLINDRITISNLYDTDIMSTMQWIKNNNYSFKYYPSPKLYSVGPIYNIADLYSSNNALYVDTSDNPFWRVIGGWGKLAQPMYSRMINSISDIKQSDVNNVLLLRVDGQKDQLVKVKYKNASWWIDPTLTYEVLHTSEVNTKDLITEIDWYKDGYNAGMTPIYVDESKFKTMWESLGKPSFVQTIVNGKWVWLENKQTYWDVVGAEKGTIGLIDFNSTTVDNSYNIGVLLGRIRDYVLTNEELNEFFFDMIRYVLTEQNSVHWFFKTSYMHISGYSASMEKTPVLTKDAVESLIDYINEVKPYHVKVRDYTSMYDTYCGKYSVTVSNEIVSTKEYKALRSPYDKLPFDRFVWNENADIDWYIKPANDEVWWVAYKNSDGLYVCQNLSGSYRLFHLDELKLATQVIDYEYPFVDEYLPEEFTRYTSVKLKSRLYRQYVRNELDLAMLDLIQMYNISFT